MSIVGIDLGTTILRLATLDDRGQPVTVPNRDGELLTPSAVLIADGEAVVGQPALDVALEQPERVATLIKRRMGQPDYGRPVAGAELSPGNAVGHHPSQVGSGCRSADRPDIVGRSSPSRHTSTTLAARRRRTPGRIAGLDVLDILDEPSAAALAYAFQSPPAAAGGLANVVLVYDLGGGTFDVTLVRLAQRHFQTLAIEGDVQLGGKDWDDRLVAYVADRFHEEYGDDPRSDRAVRAPASRGRAGQADLEPAATSIDYL